MDEPQIMHAGAAEEAEDLVAGPVLPAKMDPGPDQEWKLPVADEVIEDSRGRKIKLRVLTFLNEADLMDIAGPGRAENQPWMWMANLVCRVQEIDGEKMEFPKNAIGLRKVMQVVGNEGFSALVQRYQPPPDDPDADDEKKPEKRDIGAGAKN